MSGDSSWLGFIRQTVTDLTSSPASSPSNNPSPTSGNRGAAPLFQFGRTSGGQSQLQKVPGKVTIRGAAFPPRTKSMEEEKSPGSGLYTTPMQERQRSARGSVSEHHHHYIEESNESIPPLSPSLPSSADQTAASNTDTDKPLERRIRKTRALLHADNCNMEALRAAGWGGLPMLVRASVWRILTGYLPANKMRRAPALVKKRQEYVGYCHQHYCAERSPTEEETMKQIQKDIPRLCPEMKLFQDRTIRQSVERVLFVWAVRHPASGYVQGIDDLCVPFFVVFLLDALAERAAERIEVVTALLALPFAPAAPLSRAGHKSPLSPTSPGSGSGRNKTSSTSDQSKISAHTDIPPPPPKPKVPTSPVDKFPDRVWAGVASGDALVALVLQYEGSRGEAMCNVELGVQLEALDVKAIPAEALETTEADCFWCMSQLVGAIQDHYIFAQPGIQRMVFKLSEIVRRVDATLHEHITSEGLQFIQFAFRWMNNMLMRELSLPHVIRVWDTYMSEENTAGFKMFHVYVCAALMMRWADELKKMPFQDLVMFLQHLPTDTLQTKDIEALLSQAFIYKSLFEGSNAHLQG